MPSSIKEYLKDNIGNAIYLRVKSVEGGRPIPAGIIGVDDKKNVVIFLKGKGLREIKEVESQKLTLEEKTAQIDAIYKNLQNTHAVSIDEIIGVS